MHPTLSQGSAQSDDYQKFLDEHDNADDSFPEPKLYSQDTQFWYPDGTIIIVAQGIGFRIYKGLLAEASEIFRDMFDNATPTPQPSQVKKSALHVDICPAVTVTDTAAEIRSLLNVLLHGRQYMHGRDLDFEDLANCIRLTHKYTMHDIYEDLMGYLKKIFPEDFETWEAHASHWQNHPHTDAIVAVGLANLTDTPSILPIALYLCCQLQGSYLFAGRTRTDGAVDRLSTDDLIRCFDAKAKFSSAVFRFIPRIFGPLSNPACTALTNECETELENLHQLAIDETPWDESDILTTWGTNFNDTDSPICQSCTANFRQRDADIREHIWSDLSGILGL